ncbi:putative sulfate exporter family transporter, partial [Terriglobus sp. YAF25]
MSTVLASPDTSARSSASVYRGLLRLLPGIALLFGIGFLGKLIEHEFTHLRTEYHLRLPQIEYVLWAIILGLIVSNSIGVKPIFRPGVATYELWLKLGIVLVGARFVFSDV